MHPGWHEESTVERIGERDQGRTTSSAYRPMPEENLSPPRSVSSDCSSTSPDHSFVHRNQNVSDFRQNILPPCFHTIPESVGRDELEFLQGKGAFTIPNITLRKQLLDSYSEFTHWYVPVFDLPDFSKIIESASGYHGKISLLLFHAIMFAGSASVNIEHLQAAGYSNRREARTILFQKAKVGELS